MKFYNTSLESVRILEINESEFALYMAKEEGNVAIAMPGKNRPEIYSSMAEAQAKVDEIIQVVHTKGMQYAQATIA